MALIVFYIWLMKMLTFTVELSEDREMDSGTALSKVVGCE